MIIMLLPPLKNEKFNGSIATKSMKQYLFSYGSLQNDETQMKLFGRLLDGSEDELKGYQITIIEVTDETFLSKGEEKFQRTLMHSGNELDKVKGTVLEMTEAELLLTDKFEPVNYKRIRVVLASGKRAWIYIAV